MKQSCRFFVVMFGLIYFYLGDEHITPATLCPSLLTMIYYSVVAFTTLGFGDIAPVSPTGAIFVMIEVILGYIMLGGLISIFTNKLARTS